MVVESWRSFLRKPNEGRGSAGSGLNASRYTFASGAKIAGFVPPGELQAQMLSA